jgi:hypothetical protein
MYAEVEQLISALNSAETDIDQGREAIYAEFRASDRADVDRALQTAKHDKSYSTYVKAIEAAWETFTGATQDPLAKFIAENVRERHPAQSLTILRMLPCSMEALDELAQQQGWCDTYSSYVRLAEEAGALPGSTPISAERAALCAWFRDYITSSRGSLATLMMHVDAVLNGERPITDTPTGDVDAVGVEPADHDQDGAAQLDSADV